MRAQAEKFGAETVDDDIVEVDLTGDIETVTDTAGTVHRAKTVIVATGSADVILTLTAHTDSGEADVTVAERDLGVIGHARLRPDLARARFLDTDTPARATTSMPSTSSTVGAAAADGQVAGDVIGTGADHVLAAAALPLASGALQGHRARRVHPGR